MIYMTTYISLLQYLEEIFQMQVQYDLETNGSTYMRVFRTVAPKRTPTDTYAIRLEEHKSLSIVVGLLSLLEQHMMSNREDSKRNFKWVLGTLNCSSGDITFSWKLTTEKRMDTKWVWGIVSGNTLCMDIAAPDRCSATVLSQDDTQAQQQLWRAVWLSPSRKMEQSQQVLQ